MSQDLYILALIYGNGDIFQGAIFLGVSVSDSNRTSGVKLASR